MTSDSKPSAKTKYLKTIKEIILEIIQYKRTSVLPILLGTIINNMLRGVGIALLIPSLTLLTPQNQVPGHMTKWLQSFFAFFNVEISLNGLLILIVVVIIATAVIERYISIKVNHYQVDMKQHVRQKLFDRIMHMPWQNFIQYNTSELIRLIDSEINQFARSANNIFNLFVNSLHALVYIIAAALIHWQITIAMLLASSLLLLISVWFNQAVVRHASHVNINRASIYQTSLDILHNFKFAKVQGLESKMHDRKRHV